MEIAAVGVSIAIFNQVSKVCIYPLVSVTTSFVAEEDAIISKGVEEEKSEDLEKASSADNDMNELPSFSGICTALQPITFIFIHAVPKFTSK